MSKYKIAVNKFFSHLFFIFIPSFFGLFFAMFSYRFLLISFKENFISWFIMSIFLYFIPTCVATIFLLQKWNNKARFICARLFSTDGKYIKFDKKLFKFIVESLTLLMTFIILISSPYGIKPLNNPFDSLLFVIYPINLGFIVWDYIYPTDKKEITYQPWRKFK